MDPFEQMLNQLCHLVIRLERRMAEGLATAHGPVVLDTPAVGVLVGLEMFGSLRPAALGAVLGMSSGGTTKRIDRLQARGLVARRLGAVPEDRRAVLIELTDVGREALGAFERLLVFESSAWVDALAPLADARYGGRVTVPAPLTPGSPAVPPATTALFHLVGAIDQAVIEAVGEIELLHPNDPRPLLLLSELDLRGPAPVGATAALVGRSRVSTNALLADLAAAGLLRRGPGKEAPDDRSGCDRRNVFASITPKGRRTLRSVRDSLENWAPRLQPLVLGFMGAVEPAIDARR
jgi:DNA-binding MarR family transcriptional regulator